MLSAASHETSVEVRSVRIDAAAVKCRLWPRGLYSSFDWLITDLAHTYSLCAHLPTDVGKVQFRVCYLRSKRMERFLVCWFLDIWLGICYCGNLQ